MKNCHGNAASESRLKAEQGSSVSSKEKHCSVWVFDEFTLETYVRPMTMMIKIFIIMRF